MDSLGAGAALHRSTSPGGKDSSHDSEESSDIFVSGGRPGSSPSCRSNK